MVSELDDLSAEGSRSSPEEYDPDADLIVKFAKAGRRGVGTSDWTVELNAAAFEKIIEQKTGEGRTPMKSMIFVMAKYSVSMGDSKNI